jgi:hypothetical protein
MADNLTAAGSVIGAQREAVLCPGKGNVDTGVIVGAIGTFDEELEQKFEKFCSRGSGGCNEDLGRGQAGDKTDDGDQQRQPDRQVAH